MLAASGWVLNADNNVFGCTTPHGAPQRICQRFRFSSILRRMSVVVIHHLPSGVEPTYLVCTKGSPEVILPMLWDSPPDYDEAYLTMTRRGARVLAYVKTFGFCDSDVCVALLNEAGSTKSDSTQTVIKNSGTASSVDCRLHSNHTCSTREDERQSAQTRLASQLAAIEAEQDPSHVRLGDAIIAALFTAKMFSSSRVSNYQTRSMYVGHQTSNVQNSGHQRFGFRVQFFCSVSVKIQNIRCKSFNTDHSSFRLVSVHFTIQAFEDVVSHTPILNIFNLYTLLTVTLQFLVHISVLCTLTQEAGARMPINGDDFADVHAEFEPSILNTVGYLISTSIQIATIAVNHKGHSFICWRTKELLSLGVAIGGVFLLALGMFAEPRRLMLLDLQLQKVFLQAGAFDFIATWMVYFEVINIIRCRKGIPHDRLHILGTFFFVPLL
ncbi:unnamed protein product [Echinostoma caproni]|uniref:GpcrRhopsn4 domain-containing protein n=1 Tax=Echinostoma caproni TaxID=27848 RepID=A0A183B479_9TREM|nr:unnamed protein product [Echinostoma caproni]